MFSDVWSENAALFERLTEIHSNPPILYYGYKFKDGPQLILCATWPRRPAGYNNSIPIPHIKAVLVPLNLMCGNGIISFSLYFINVMLNAHVVCHPYKQKHIDALESVQRRATRYVPSLKGLSYKERLCKLKLPTLVYRRVRGDMIETFKNDQDLPQGCYSCTGTSYYYWYYQGTCIQIK